MKAFQVVEVPANGEANVELRLGLEDLKYLDADLQRTIEPGSFNLYLNDLERPIFTVEY